MEMPYNLQTLPPEAIDILRYYSTLNVDTAHADEIVDGTGLTERGFGKGIRRLVTKNYMLMSSDQVYRLTDQGRRVLDEVKNYTGDSSDTSDDAEARFLRRHLVILAPRTLPVGQTVEITLGFEEAEDAEYLSAPANMFLRLSVVNGEPQQPVEKPFMLTNQHMQEAFQITAGSFSTARIRVEVCQYRDEGDEFDFCGGMYVDLPVATGDADSATAAYGIDVILKED